MTKLRPFVPEFYGAEDTGKKGKWTITVENLLDEKENASYADLKLGTSTLTSGK